MCVSVVNALQSYHSLSHTLAFDTHIFFFSFHIESDLWFAHRVESVFFSDSVMSDLKSGAWPPLIDPQIS